ncbi:MAG TPA: Thioredoxin reductase [Hyphomicrobiaceae bacterium MAG_BT-2024]
MIILGSGPAGYTAAIYAARAMTSPLIVKGAQPGGQLTITNQVENYPGFSKPIDGTWLMQQMEIQAVCYGAEVIADHIVSVSLDEYPFKLIGDSGKTYTCRALIIATGAQVRWLGLPSEKAYRGYGVSACATCDGFFFRNKQVVVVGGGNTAVEEALFLTNYARQVTLVHRRDNLKAEKILQDRLFKNQSIKIVWNSVIDEIRGNDDPKQVTHVVLSDVKTEALTKLTADGVFIAVGHAPATSLFSDQLDMCNRGYIITHPDSTRTSIPGVFAAGDVTDDVFRQAITSAGMGCMAALEAERWLATFRHAK